MIPGISDKRRLPRLGKLRLGEKRLSKNNKEYPASIDYFMVDSELPGLNEAFEKVYGPKPRELDILLPLEDAEVFFPQALKAYRKSGLFCASDDGVTAKRVRLKDDEQGKDAQGEAFIAEQGLQVAPGDMYEMPCPHTECPYFQSKKCKGIARFMFMLPKVNGFGVWEISTSSRNGIVNLNSMLDAIRGAAGRVSYIPLKLRLVEQELKTPEGKQKKWILRLDYDGNVGDLVNIRETGKLPAPVSAGALPAPDPKEVPDDLVPYGGDEEAQEKAEKAKAAATAKAEPRRASEKAAPKAAAKPAKPAPLEPEVEEPAPPKAGKKAKDGESHMEFADLKVKAVKRKPMGEGFRYHVLFQEGQDMATMDEALARKAHLAVGVLCRVGYKVSQGYLELITLEPATDA